MNSKSQSPFRALGVYVHIPVCGSKCGYCDFYSVTNQNRDSDFWNNLLQSLIKDLNNKLKRVSEKYFLHSIYFGGGTPSLAPPDFLFKLISVIKENFAATHLKTEITLEANPETISNEYAVSIKEAGINRISLGVQSLSEEELQYLDRHATSQDVYNALSILEKTKFSNINADIIYALPGQTFRSLEYTVRKLLEYPVTHISAYSLTLAKNTRLPEEILAKKKKSPSARKDYLHYTFLQNLLRKNGFTQYEVSNYTRAGFESAHNLLYWKYRAYLGIGPSAHSFLPPYRYRNTPDLNTYLKNPESTEKREKSETWPELFIGSLRLCNRQGNSLYKRNLSTEQWKIFEKLKKEFVRSLWLNECPGGFQITPEGILHSDTMLEKIVQKATEI